MWQAGRGLLSRAAVAWVASAGILGGAQTAPAGESLKTAETKSLSKLEGRVAHAFTGEPLRRARVGLSRQGGGLRPFALITGRDGRFVFENLEPGTYSLWAERDGFLAESYGARRPGGQGVPITVSAGMHLRDLELKLTPHGAISGRLVDDEGEPVPRAYVHVVRAETNWSSQHAQTNDLGEFRIAGLAPGRYRLRANPTPRFRYGQVIVPQPPELREPNFWLLITRARRIPPRPRPPRLAPGRKCPGLPFSCARAAFTGSKAGCLGSPPSTPPTRCLSCCCRGRGRGNPGTCRRRRWKQMESSISTACPPVLTMLRWHHGREDSCSGRPRSR